MARRYRYQPDAAFLAEYQEILPKGQLQPEEKLMAAILGEALLRFRENVFGRSEQEMKLFKEAEDWILSEESRWLYSFESICLNLDIDCWCLRKKLAAWKFVQGAPSQKPVKQISPSAHHALKRKAPVTEPRSPKNPPTARRARSSPP